MKRKFWLGLALGAVVLIGGVGVRKWLRRHPDIASAVVLDDSPRQARPLQIGEMIYDRKLADGWDDWGWGRHETGNGPAKIVFEGYGGIILHHSELSQSFGGLSFRYQAPAAFADFLQVSLRVTGEPDDSFPTVLVRTNHVAKLPDGWNEVLIDWKELNPKERPFDRVLLAARTQVSSEPVSLDRIFFTPAVVGPAQGSSMRVLCDGDTRPISDMIYGAALVNWESGQSAHRMGGNPLTRTNWELGLWNVGKDWYFENQPQKTTLLQEIDAAARNQHRLAVVVPMIGWVAKDGTSAGFPRSRFPKQRAFDPYRAEAGDGFSPDGKPLKSAEPELTSMPAPPELIAKWIGQVVAADAKRGSRAVHTYILDNEPTLWNTTHRDVHPEPLSYDELLDRTIKYATAIRDADPGALIAGPAEWGWLGYHGSAVDLAAGNGAQPDRQRHGGVPLVPWLLRQLAEHEKRTGKRLLDVLDLHFYPAGDGVFDGGRVDPATAALRLRQTRALWDPSYRDESWINERIRLIPLMKEWVAQNYPGLKLMIGEWSFGAEGHISGGLAAAEALGRFGQQGLDAGFYWGEAKNDTPVFWAFRAFRNFDGKGGRFQDLAVPVEESPRVSLFASVDASKKHMVLVLVNRQLDAPAAAEIELKSCGMVTSTLAYSYGATSKALAPAPAKAALGSVTTSLEPASLMVIDLKLER